MKNIGGRNLVEQWNHCIEYANGDYLVLAADDDLYQPDFVKEVFCWQKNILMWIQIRSRAEQIDENGNLIGIDGILPEYCSKYGFIIGCKQLHSLVLVTSCFEHQQSK